MFVVAKPVCLFLIAVLLCAGTSCGRNSVEQAERQSNEAATGSESDGSVARQAFNDGKLDEAAESVYAELIRDDENQALILLAAQIESARNNHQRAVELLSSIDLNQTAAELLVDQATRTGDASTVESTIVQMIRNEPGSVPWRRRYRNFLIKHGRRQEAAVQVDALCQIGEVTTGELLSLLRRSETFPLPKRDGKIDLSGYTTPLARARCLLADEQLERALSELESQDPSEIQHPANAALHLRLLAEQQRLDDFARVHAQCSDETGRYADYWVAVGLISIDRGQYRSAIGMLLRAVQIDPTMRIAFQRLSKCFSALGQTDDAEQFRFRGVQLAQMESIGRRLVDRQDHAEVKSELARRTLQLGRPLEALHWTLAALPADAGQQRAAVVRQIRQTAMLPELNEIPVATALLEIDPAQFPYADELANLRRDANRRDSTRATDPTYTPRPPSAIPRLVNVATEAGADFQWYHDVDLKIDSIPLFESIGGGIAVLDYDLDGWPDLYFAQGSGRPPDFQCTRSNELRRNIEGMFSDVTNASGSEDFHYGSGLAAGDVNQDGFPDLYVGSVTRNRLLINNGDGTFRDASVTLGDQQASVTSSLAIADLDGDHLPDLFEVNYIESEGAFAQPELDADGNLVLPSPLLFLPQPDRWFRAKPDGTFAVTEIDSAIAAPATGLGIIVTDFDGRPGNEIFVGNDLRPNHFLRHRDGSFVNQADVMGIANGWRGLANGCMGIATGDFDRNGTLDMHVANYRDESDNLFLQTGDGLYRDAAPSYQLRSLTTPYVGFGTKAIDIDRNGWLDFVLTNGHIFDMRRVNQGYRMPPQIFLSSGDRFQEASVEDPSGYWKGNYLGRAMAILDFNRDGDSDVVIGHLDAPAALLENQTKTTGTSVMFELIGTVSERDAIGAKVIVHAGSDRIANWVTGGDGYMSSDEPFLEFAITDSDTIDHVEVFWPTGEQQTYHGIFPGNRYVLIENEPDPHQRDTPAETRR